MNIEELRNFCLSLPDTEEKLPFDDSTLVFCVKNKMFCLTDIEEYDIINLKCDPEQAIELREKYPDVIPGYHMNKRHWNSIKTDTVIADSLLKEWIIKSYRLVIAGMSQKTRHELEQKLQILGYYNDMYTKETEV